MKLYVCWGTFTTTPRPGGHPCGNAYRALKDAGYDPEVIRSYGLGILPGVFNQTRGRREAKELTGSYSVPVLVTDDGDVVADSRKIVAWAEAHPAATANA
jgi:Glutathione S-transferase, N-terminal domain